MTAIRIVAFMAKLKPWGHFRFRMYEWIGQWLSVRKASWFVWHRNIVFWFVICVEWAVKWRPTNESVCVCVCLYKANRAPNEKCIPGPRTKWASGNNDKEKCELFSGMRMPFEGDFVRFSWNDQSGDWSKRFLGQIIRHGIAHMKQSSSWASDYCRHWPLGWTDNRFAQQPKQ